MEIVLIVCGIIGIITLLLNLFSSIGDHPEKRWASDIPTVGSMEFITAISRLISASPEHGDEVTLLNNGDEFLPKFLEILGHAQKTITFAVYAWNDGKMSERVLQVLAERARAGVEVRVLLDGFGAMFISADLIKTLTDAGGLVATFRPAHFGKYTRLHRRNHRRAIVIDGKIGFTGGMAMSDHWLGSGKRPGEWRDMMFLLKGAMVHDLQGAFAQLWAGTTGEILVGDKFYAEIPVSSYPSTYVSVVSSPSPDTAPLPNFYWLSISAARKTIYMIYPYLIPDKYILRAIRKRARAGVTIKILLPGKRTDAKPIRWASASYYETLLASGVEIYEYQPSLIHTKVMVIDGNWSIIGSANMDPRSKELNEENVFGISDVSLAHRLEETFFSDITRAKKITLEEWRKNHKFIRFLGYLLLLFTKQY